MFTESPGSQTFEVQDIPAIVKAAHDAGAVVILDNTWATPLYFKPFAHGVDVSIQAATKYIVGHADAMLGAITASEKTARAVEKSHEDLGLCPGPEDAYLGLRGLRTLAVRLARHQQSALELARWLGSRVRRSPACCTRPFPPIPAMLSGSATSPAPPDCSPLS